MLPYPLYCRGVQYQTIFTSSLVDYAYAQTLCALESRIAHSVTMERRSFARTLLWRNNHIHDTLLAVYQKFRQTSTGCIFSFNWQQNGTTATESEINLRCLHKMSDMNNNNYIASLYSGDTEYIARSRTILHLSYGRVQYGPSLSNIFWYPPHCDAI